MQKQDMIYEDFMEDRAIKMFKDDELNYSVYVQVFTTDNLPFSPITGDKNISFLTMTKQPQMALQLVMCAATSSIKLHKNMKLRTAPMLLEK